MSYCHNYKNCGNDAVKGTILCWDCHDECADIRNSNEKGAVE